MKGLSRGQPVQGVFRSESASAHLPYGNPSGSISGGGVGHKGHCVNTFPHPAHSPSAVEAFRERCACIRCSRTRNPSMKRGNEMAEDGRSRHVYHQAGYGFAMASRLSVEVSPSPVLHQFHVYRSRRGPGLRANVSCILLVPAPKVASEIATSC